MSRLVPRVLSIQSHVVHGYVGNKSAVFPLQLLGYDVDVVNTVQFSNHTGYPAGWEGSKLEAEELSRVMKGLERNGLTDSITHILQGYCPSASLLKEIHQASIVSAYAASVASH
jgi:pyridoxine kinase